jgi:hypothetical protein
METALINCVVMLLYRGAINPIWVPHVMSEPVSELFAVKTVGVAEV